MFFFWGLFTFLSLARSVLSVHEKRIHKFSNFTPFSIFHLPPPVFFLPASGDIAQSSSHPSGWTVFLVGGIIIIIIIIMMMMMLLMLKNDDDDDVDNDNDDVEK